MAAPAMTSLDDIAKPPPGVVLPPKDIKTTIEKTAGFVARNGPAFEERIRSKESSNPKFSFLLDSDPYNLFYQWRLNEIKEGRGTDVAAGRVGEQAAAKEPEKPKGPPQPPDFEFSARMPTINAQDLDVVRLTALYTAKNGRSFMSTLLQREAGNFQFDFLRPQHSLYQYFSRLVDQYTALIQGSTVEGGKPEKLRIAALEQNVKNRYQILERAKQRAEWAKYQEQQKAMKEEEAEAEQLAYAQIDWHDFVVVETVLFTEADEQAELPPPTSLNDLQTASLEQKAMMAVNPGALRIEEAFPGEDVPSYQAPAPAVQSPAPGLPYMHQPPAPSISPSVPVGAYVGNGSAPYGHLSEEEQRIRERAEERARAEQTQAAARAPAGAVKVRNDYVPRAQARRQNVAMALCPNCKQQIPVNELENHMRIELLDPQWKEQKEKAESRYATTNLSTADVANNLKRLASQRSDVFDGVTGLPISEEEAARRKKAALSYDGTSESRDAARMQGLPSMNIEEQLKQIQQKFSTPKAG